MSDEQPDWAEVDAWLAGPTTMPLDEIMARWRPWSPDDSETWPERIADLTDSDRVHRIRVAGAVIREPVELGDDGRIWDGHHRITVAYLDRLAEVPVIHVTKHAGMTTKAG